MYYGKISVLKRNFGYIKRPDSNLDVFFHFSDFTGDRAQLQPGLEVSFCLSEDAVASHKHKAVNVQAAPPGSTQFEVVCPTLLYGQVLKLARNEGHGALRTLCKDGQLLHFLFCLDQSSPACLTEGDFVSFSLATDVRNLRYLQDQHSPAVSQARNVRQVSDADFLSLPSEVQKLLQALAAFAHLQGLVPSTK